MQTFLTVLLWNLQWDRSPIKNGVWICRQCYKEQAVVGYLLAKNKRESQLLKRVFIVNHFLREVVFFVVDGRRPPNCSKVIITSKINVMSSALLCGSLQLLAASLWSFAVK